MTVRRRVLLISHTCQSRAEGHSRAEQMAEFPDIDLRVLVPNRWKHYGRWRQPDPPRTDAFTYDIQPVLWPWAGPAQAYLHWYPHLRRTLREFRPDIIDLWEEPWSLVSAQTCRLRDLFLPEAKIISETEQNINRVLPPPFEALRRYSLRRADFAVARSGEALAVLRAKGYTGLGEVVPNAVDASLFRPLDRAQCRRDLGLPGFVVGYVGRLVEEKGLADMVAALAFCPEDVQCVFIGSGPQEDTLRQQAQALGKTAQVHFLAGRPQHELPPLMNALDVLALVSRTTPTWKEQFGRVIIEAQACGTPVLGSDSGAIPEVVGPGGLIIPERNPQALAEALTELRAAPDHTRRLGHAGRQQVEARYTWGQTARQMHSIYTTL